MDLGDVCGERLHQGFHGSIKRLIVDELLSRYHVYAMGKMVHKLRH